MITKPEIMFFRRPGTRRLRSTLDREWRDTGREEELWAQVQTWRETGHLPSAWHHAEPGTEFEALGPPRSTVRLYYAKHAGQIVLLHARIGKSRTGKLLTRTKVLVERRLAEWKRWFPHGADLNEEGLLSARPKDEKE